MKPKESVFGGWLLVDYRGLRAIHYSLATILLFLVSCAHGPKTDPIALLYVQDGSILELDPDATAKDPVCRSGPAFDDVATLRRRLAGALAAS